MSRRNKYRHDNRSDNSDKDDDDGEYEDGGNNTRGGIGQRMTYCGRDAIN